MNSRFLRRCGGARGSLGSDGLSGRAGVIAWHVAWHVVWGVAMALTAGEIPAVEIPPAVRAAERARIEARQDNISRDLAKQKHDGQKK